MFEYSYTPERKKKTVKFLTAILYFAAVILYGFISTFELEYEGFMQLVSLASFAAATLLLTRFIFKKIIYRVVERDVDSYDLVVDEMTGKSRVSICRIALANIERVEIHTTENNEELRQMAQGRKIFSYCPDMFPTGECWVFVTECGEELLLMLYADDTLLSILRSAQDHRADGEEL